MVIMMKKMNRNKNIYRETIFTQKMEKRGFKVVSLNNVLSKFPDLVVLTKNNKIKYLGNTGAMGTDYWEKIGEKIQRLINNGFEFEDVVYFYRDRDLEKMKINEDGDKFKKDRYGNNIYSPLENGLNNTDFVSDDFVRFSINGSENLVTFVPMGFIN